MAASSSDPATEIATELRALRQDMPTTRDHMRLEADLAAIRTEIAALRVTMETQSRADVDLESLDPKFQALERRIPPIPTLVAAVSVIVAILGFSYRDITQLQVPIKKASENVESSATQLSTVARTLTGISDALVQRQNEIAKALDGISARVSSATENLTDFDRTLASLAAEIGVLSSSVENVEITAANTILSTDPLEAALAELGADIGKQRGYVGFLVQGQAALDRGEYDRARGLLSKARDLDPDDTEGLYDLLIARSYQLEGKLREAIGAYGNAILREPDLSSAYNNLGSIYWRMAQDTGEQSERTELLRKALESQSRAYEIDPENTTAAVNVSVVLNALGRWNESQEILEPLRDRGQSTVHLQLASTYALQGRETAATRELTEAFELEPGPKIALLAASDPDFEQLRETDAFLKLLESQLGKKGLVALKTAWRRVADRSDDSDRAELQ